MLEEFEDRDLVLMGDVRVRVEFSLDFFLDFRLGFLTGESGDAGLSGDESGKPRNGERARGRDRELRWSLKAWLRL